MAAFLHSQQNPKKPAWKIKSERHEAKRAKKKRVADEFFRRHFRQHNAALKAGEFSAIFDPSRGYLGILEDVGTGKLPSERLVDWVGAGLASDAIEGFKSVLFHPSRGGFRMWIDPDYPSLMDMLSGCKCFMQVYSVFRVPAKMLTALPPNHPDQRLPCIV
ncbi:hypothetical protein OKW39_007191 [Paraburkholderia sp. MM6662-R1]